MNRAVGENGFSSIRIFMEIGVVVCLNLGIIGDILKMADNFVGQIMGVQKFMPVGNRMPGEDGIKDFCQLPYNRPAAWKNADPLLCQDVRLLCRTR